MKDEIVLKRGQSRSISKKVGRTSSIRAMETSWGGTYQRKINQE